MVPQVIEVPGPPQIVKLPYEMVKSCPIPRVPEGELTWGEILQQTGRVYDALHVCAAQIDAIRALELKTLENTP